MIADAFVILRYGHGEVGLTGWGVFWGICLFSYAAGSSTTHYVRDRAIRRAAPGRKTEQSDETTVQP